MAEDEVVLTGKDHAEFHVLNIGVAVRAAHHGLYARTVEAGVWIELTWQHAVLPYLHEHFLGEEERLSEFSLNALRRNPPTDQAPEAQESSSERSEPPPVSLPGLGPPP